MPSSTHSHIHTAVWHKSSWKTRAVSSAISRVETEVCSWGTNLKQAGAQSARLASFHFNPAPESRLDAFNDLPFEVVDVVLSHLFGRLVEDALESVFLSRDFLYYSSQHISAVAEPLFHALLPEARLWLSVLPRRWRLHLYDRVSERLSFLLKTSHMSMLPASLSTSDASVLARNTFKLNMVPLWLSHGRVKAGHVSGGPGSGGVDDSLVETAMLLCLSDARRAEPRDFLLLAKGLMGDPDEDPPAFSQTLIEFAIDAFFARFSGSDAHDGGTSTQAMPAQFGQSGYVKLTQLLEDTLDGRVVNAQNLMLPCLVGIYLGQQARATGEELKRSRRSEPHRGGDGAHAEEGTAVDLSGVSAAIRHSGIKEMAAYFRTHTGSKVHYALLCGIVTGFCPPTWYGHLPSNDIDSVDQSVFRSLLGECGISQLVCAEVRHSHWLYSVQQEGQWMGRVTRDLDERMDSLVGAELRLRSLPQQGSIGWLKAVSLDSSAMGGDEDVYGKKGKLEVRRFLLSLRLLMEACDDPDEVSSILLYQVLGVKEDDQVEGDESSSACEGSSSLFGRVGDLTDEERNILFIALSDVLPLIVYRASLHEDDGKRHRLALTLLRVFQCACFTAADVTLFVLTSLAGSTGSVSLSALVKVMVEGSEIYRDEDDEEGEHSSECFLSLPPSSQLEVAKSLMYIRSKTSQRSARYGSISRW